MIKEELELLCIGNALVDVFAGLSEQQADRYGITQPVQHVEIQKLRGILSELSGSTAGITEVSGGGAANVAKIAAFLGVNVCFSGALGKSAETGNADEEGQLFEKDLASAAVELKLALKPSPTGICLILNTGHNKTRIAAAPSAALEFSEADLCEEDIQRARVVVLDGFMLDRGGIVRHILRLADQGGTVAALDLSSVSIAREYAAEIAGYVRQYSLILFMNEAEAVAFYDELETQGLGLPPDEEENRPGETSIENEKREENSRLRRVCSFFQFFTGRDIFPIIVVKLGKRGALCFAGGAIHRAGTMEHKPLDATGAGDTFCAAFLAAWIRAKTLTECTALGNRAARIILDVTGTLAEKKQFKSIAHQLK